MQEENLSPQQSLRIIQQMVGKTRAGFGNNSHYFLLWGWLAFAAMLCQYALKVWWGVHQHYQVWWVTVVGVVATVIMSRRQERNRRVSTYVDDSIKYLWTALGISFFTLTLVLGLGKVGFEHCYSFYILMYAIGTFTTGCLIKFRPLIIGGIACWGLSVATAFTGFDEDLLLAAVAMLVSYIIPGHLLRLKQQ
jgi:hypothetical protein